MSLHAAFRPECVFRGGVFFCANNGLVNEVMILAQYPVGTAHKSVTLHSIVLADMLSPSGQDVTRS